MPVLLKSLKTLMKLNAALPKNKKKKKLLPLRQKKLLKMRLSLKLNLMTKNSNKLSLTIKKLKKLKRIRLFMTLTLKLKNVLSLKVMRSMLILRCCLKRLNLMFGVKKPVIKNLVSLRLRKRKIVCSPLLKALS